jgi:hypothetical protein
MVSRDPFGYLKHRLWPKERPGVKLAIWLSTTKNALLKVGNRPDFLACRWRATYHWKALNESYNFALDLTSIKDLHAKLWAPKVVGVTFSAISGLQLGSPRTKWNLGVGPVARHREYYKGEGGGFLQVRAVVSCVGPCLLVVRPCNKSVPTLH